MERKTLLGIINFLYHTLTYTEFVGLENVPLSGGLILATNHMSRLDVPLLFITPNRRDVNALVADKYLKFPFFRIILNAAKVIWLDREKADFSAMGIARKYIQDGGAMGIAPEGTRSSNGALIEGKAGTALLAYRANCPIVPVAVTGTETAIKKLLSFHRPKLLVRYGKAFFLPAFDAEHRSRWLAESTDEIMCRIAALLPPKYRGVYKDHPRLAELLKSPQTQ